MEIINDFNTSVEKSLSEIDKDWIKYPGLIICGTHTPNITDAENQIEKIRKAREDGTPFLGICFGHQLSAIEYARNVLHKKNATSEEWGKGEFIVVKRKDGLQVGLHNGESYWNNYEVLSNFETTWKKSDNFITCQFHPEYQSSKDKPHYILLNFLKYAKMAMQNS